MARKGGTCRMCSAVGSLVRGHVVSALVWRWLKKTSATSYLRMGDKPNQRVEDGWVRWWLCPDCEGRIGRDEKAFAENLFQPIVTGLPAPYAHGPWLARFIASIAWRGLMLVQEHKSFDDPTPEQRALIPQAQEHWRAFVHGEVETPGIHELHFVPMGPVTTIYHGDRPLPPNINRFTRRGVDLDITRNARQALVYAKMGPAIALGFIEPPSPTEWVGTRVVLGHGHVGGHMALPVEFLDYLIERAQNMADIDARRSPEQDERVAQAMRADPARASTSDTFRAIDADVAQFGIDRVFPPKAPPDAPSA